MEYVALGKTNLLLSRTSFGADALRFCPDDISAGNLILQAYGSGINFFDTSHFFPESERRLGLALQRIRQNVFLATKTKSSDKVAIEKDFYTSLDLLQTDFIDLFQIEIEESENFDLNKIKAILLQLKTEGLVHHIGIATQNNEIARMAIKTDFFETLQFPFNIITNDDNTEIVKKCSEKDIGFLAMQPLCGGVINNIPLAYGFLNQWENVIPLWGARNIEELNHILYFEAHPPVIDENFKKDSENIKKLFN